jgi:uncharacterized phage protein (TIGR01671 family)
MREIKFRLAWYKNIYQVVNIEWYKNGEVNRVKVIDKDGEITKWLYPNDKNIVLLQYTGLKDKKGKEIYEEDIVKTYLMRRDSSGAYVNGVVVYENFGFNVKVSIAELNQYYLPDYDKRLSFLRGWDEKSDKNDTYEVIGNSLENPELLKVNQ